MPKISIFRLVFDPISSRILPELIGAKISAGSAILHSWSIRAPIRNKDESPLRGKRSRAALNAQPFDHAHRAKPLFIKQASPRILKAIFQQIGPLRKMRLRRSGSFWALSSIGFSTLLKPVTNLSSLSDGPALLCLHPMTIEA